MNVIFVFPGYKGILGRRQTASQEFLELPFGGSNPPAPASNQEARDEEQGRISVYQFLLNKNLEEIECHRV